MEKFIPQALQGDLDALCALLLVLSAAIRDRVPLTPKLAEYLANELRKIADGGKRDDAFHVRRGKGQRDTREANQNAILLACAVAELRRHQPGEKPMTVDNATEMVAKERNVSADTVRAALRDYRHYIELSATPGWQLIFAPAKRPRRSKDKLTNGIDKGKSNPVGHSRRVISGKLSKSRVG